MKAERILMIGMGIALVGMSYKIGALGTGGAGGSGSKKEIALSVIHNRKSVRVFKETEITKSEIDTIIKAGMAAPTGFDKRPWKFIALTDRGTMMELRKGLKYAKGLDTSPVAIVVCGDMSKVHPEAPEFWVTDTSAATQNMLLAIEAMDLGGVWSTIYPGKDRMELATKILNLPEHIIPMCIIPIGHPAGKNYAKDKYDPTNIHWEKW